MEAAGGYQHRLFPFPWCACGSVTVRVSGTEDGIVTTASSRLHSPVLLFLEVVRYYAAVKLCGMCLIRGCSVTFSCLVDCCVCIGYLLLSCLFALLYPIRTVHTVPTSV